MTLRLNAVVFPRLSGIDLDAPDDEAYDLVLALASGSVDHSHAADMIARWIQSASGRTSSTGSDA